MEKPKVGTVVQLNVPQLLEHCAHVDPDELVKLADRDYCKTTLKLGFPFLRSPAEAQRIQVETGHSRYWKSVHQVLDLEVRITSQWHRRHLGPFLVYLVGMGLTPIGISAEMVQSEIDEIADVKAATKAAIGGARHKLHAVGNAQNSIVRYVLGTLGHESFTEKAWLGVKGHFDHRCAYCSSPRQLVMDHAVPISIQNLGEHKLGNLVPACRECNEDKGQKRYDDFLRAQSDLSVAEARIVMIEDHMRSHGYQPLSDILAAEDADQVRELVQSLRLQVAAAAEATVRSINGLLSADDGMGPHDPVGQRVVDRGSGNGPASASRADARRSR